MTPLKYIYNTNLAKGTGFINESLALIEFYEEGESKQDFLNRCIAQNFLNKSTERRTRDIINLVFYDRYWKGTNNVIQNFKALRENGLNLEALKSLFYIYTAKANQVFYDFVVELNDSKRNRKILTEDAKNFLLMAISMKKAPLWSDTMINRVSSYLISCLKNFDLINGQGYLRLNFPDQKIINYLIHELHFAGKSDMEIIFDKQWKLLGLSDYEMVREIEKISYEGTFIFQYSGEILKIGWNYQNMEEFIEYGCR